ncbi:hypothetical protein [uncultured Brachyspira sp.]|uniref:hypothetical protein n=1 Tax=uncultured Brachyspira sp. TaxID=221953 RepID=UPI0026078A02|nr:hypothetical protein [uncultured Brachyspira sp.]
MSLKTEKELVVYGGYEIQKVFVPSRGMSLKTIFRIFEKTTAHMYSVFVPSRGMSLKTRNFFLNFL